MNLLELKNLQYLHCGPIDLQIKATDITGLSGASGSGKSRLLRAVADLDEHQGDILLDKLNQQDVSAHQWRKKVGLLAAETSWWFDTVGLHFNKFSEMNIASLGFDHEIAGWSISRLSSGEKQRLGLLRLLENKPDVLLLDEPTANLDKENTRLFENVVADYLIKYSACAIWVSHDTDQLKRVCSNRYEINNGVLTDVY